VFSELLSPLVGDVLFGHRSLGSIIYAHVFAHVPDRALGSLLYSLCYVAVCFIPVLILYRKKIFIKI